MKEVFDESQLKKLKANPDLLVKLAGFYKSYMDAVKQSGTDSEQADRLFKLLIELIARQADAPYRFGLFHQSLRTPFDYYQFGLDFIRPLINFKESIISGKDQLERIVQLVSQKENVVLLANHQTEPDPQIISLLLEPDYPEFASHMIFVAGHRVVEDPIAIPMSMGCNLLCIYSKKHIHYPPENKLQKISHNQRTMRKMSELLAEGEKCIYVAPSGGRDRPDVNGQIIPAPFDPDSLELFWLMARKAKRPTHFFPLALSTYGILPPPDQVETDLGEKRRTSYTPVRLEFGKEVDMNDFPDYPLLSKKEKKIRRADSIWALVYQDYQNILKRSS